MQPNTTTMDTQHSTPSDRDESMTEENTTAPRDLRTTPKPPNWPQMTKKQRSNWFICHGLAFSPRARQALAY